MLRAYTYRTAIGKLGIAENGRAVTHLFFEGESPKDAVWEETPLLHEAYKQLESYLAGKLESFSLPLEPRGSAFLRRVWEALASIPYGETLSYGEIAKKLGSPRAARAVGLACNRNPIPIFIPCHRVVGADGRLTGYRGGVGLKARLLEMERSGWPDNAAIPKEIPSAGPQAPAE